MCSYKLASIRCSWVTIRSANWQYHFHLPLLEDNSRFKSVILFDLWAYSLYCKHIICCLSPQARRFEQYTLKGLLWNHYARCQLAVLAGKV